jgi:cytochrome c-type biogenesis protein
MEALQSWFESTNIPILSAFILGLMTAISPCPLATNITATAYISKNIASKKMVLLNGLFYTIGRGLTYTVIGLILFFGASQFQVARFFTIHGERLLGPILLIIGLVMLNIIPLRFLSGGKFQEKMSEKLKDKGLMGAMFLGVLFALAFCPYSGALYFGILIPMTIASVKGLLLPPIFAIGTGLPVLLFTYLIAFSIGKIGNYFTALTKIEKSMRYVAGTVFIVAGIYYISIFAGIIR